MIRRFIRSFHLPNFTRTPWFLGSALLLIVLLIGFGTYRSYQTALYDYPVADARLLSKSSIDTSLIKQSEASFSYNRTDEADPKQELQQVLAAAAEDSTGKVPYSAVLATDPKKGVTFSDSKGERAVSMTPNFELSEGKLMDGRVTYPASTTERHSYTFKRNGLKEDIILSKKGKDNVRTFSWNLKLDSGLEARMLPDGGVGVYSADPLLFGNLTVGDEKTQKLVDNAKQNGERTYLVYELPKPYMTDARGIKNYDDVSYNLKGSRLSLTARNLTNQRYPLNIDPTITVTTTSDFKQNVGDTGNIDSTTADQIGRGSIGSGALGAYTLDTGGNYTTPRHSHTAVAYNGYLYVIGGDSGSFLATTQYAPINADGTIGAWNTTASFTTARSNHVSFAYNGYMYIVGGQIVSAATCKDSGTSIYCNDVQYAAIAADGTLGSWTTDTGGNYTTPRHSHTAVAYNGYLYVIGGDSGSFLATTQYAPINADGTIGAWNTTASFTTARSNHVSFAYNGYMYIVGGQIVSAATCKDSGTSIYCNDVQYAAIAADGTLGSWTTDTGGNYTTPRHSHTAVAYNGYLYVIGGDSGSFLATTQYAPINADGTIGAWNTTASFTTARSNHVSFAYNGYMYIVGGQIVSAATCKDSGTSIYCNDVQYAAIGSGKASDWTTDTGGNFTTARSDHETVAYNGYLYVIGGNSNPTTFLSDTQYAPINADGTIGAWGSTASFTTARYAHSAVAYNGYMYMIAGYSGSWQADVQYSLIAANGTLGAWTGTTSISDARGYHTSVAYKGYLYVIGGADATSDTECNATASQFCSDVLYASIATDGTIGSWSTTSSFTTARFYHSSVVYNGYLYVIGGCSAGNCTTHNSDIQYAAITPGGTLGTWTATTSFTTARSEHASGIFNGYLYIIGGCSAGRCTAYQSDVQYAVINSDGTLGTWTATTSFTTARSTPGVAFYNGYAYLTGGYSGSHQADTQYINIGQNNSTGTWTADTGGNFTNIRNLHSTVAYNGYIYVLGGVGAANYNDVQFAPINADGTIGTWSYTHDSINDGASFVAGFTTIRYGHTSVIYNGYLYVIGGVNVSYLNDVQYAPLNANGTVGTWVTDTGGNFTTPRGGHTSVVYNGYLYVMGGFDGSYYGDVQYAPINSGGDIGAWVTTTSFTYARADHTSVVHNGYLYVMGGYHSTSDTLCSDVSENRCRDVQYAPINSNGSLGTWVFTARFFNARDKFTAGVSNGHLYIVGGHDGSAYLNDMQIAPINADGSISAWASNSSFTTARRGLSSTIYNGYIYFTGGTNGTNQNDTQYAPILTNMYRARYERTFDTTAGGNNLSSFIVNGTTKCKFTASYRLAGSDGIYGSAITLTNVLPGTSQSITGGTSKRYLSLVVLLDDATCGGTSTISSITLTYNGAPDIPTLLLPANNATNVTFLPEFRLGSADDSQDYIKYKIEVCSTSNCSAIVRTIDQVSSQTGWMNQSTQSATAYTGGATITQYGIHLYQSTALSPSTQYWWRGYATDPGGTNQTSAASGIFSFTTRAATPAQTNIGGGTTIYGGTTIGGN